MQNEKENFYFRDRIHRGFFFFFFPPSEPRAKETAAIKVLATGAESGIENSVLFGKPFSFKKEKKRRGGEELESLLVAQVNHPFTRKLYRAFC